MTKAQEVGQRIAQARREKGVREAMDVRPVDLARALGVSQATVSDWESGKTTPREEALARLSVYLGVTPAYLRYGVTSPETVVVNGVQYTDVTEDVGGRDAKVAEGARLAKQAADQKKRRAR